ncbi:hypothetical protein ACFVWG_27825 [Kribbella sp. NPDC058245]|uniref:hypothetical protein n=1 Tax=Kribbella sp. NPDC058245 TaxID=3346399 RepID=UPI0036EF77F4
MQHLRHLVETLDQPTRYPLQVRRHERSDLIGVEPLYVGHDLFLTILRRGRASSL